MLEKPDKTSKNDSFEITKNVYRRLIFHYVSHRDHYDEQAIDFANLVTSSQSNCMFTPVLTYFCNRNVSFAWLVGSSAIEFQSLVGFFFLLVILRVAPD